MWGCGPLLSVIGQEVTAADGGGGGVYRPVSKQVGIPTVRIYSQSDRISQRAVPCVCVWVVGGLGVESRCLRGLIVNTCGVPRC